MPGAMSGNNGKMAVVGVVLSIAALIFVVFQLMDAKIQSQTDLLGQQIATLERQIREANEDSQARREAVGRDLSHHESIKGHPSATNKLTELEQKLLEVETQFRHTDRLIQLLWGRVYSESLPNSVTDD